MTTEGEQRTKGEGVFQDAMTVASMGLVEQAVSISPINLDEVELSIARMTAGIDHEGVDRGSHDYKIGVSDALSETVLWLRHSKFSLETEEIVEKSGGDKMLRYLAKNSGVSFGTLAKRSGEKFLTFGRKFMRLKRAKFIDPTKSVDYDGLGWELSIMGRQMLALHEARKIQRELIKE